MTSSSSVSGRNSYISQKKANKRAKWGLIADGGPASLFNRYENFIENKIRDKLNSE